MLSRRTSSRRLRALVIAEACNPEWTSVPLLAYHWYRALRDRVDVTLVTQVRNKPAFERCRDHDANVVFIDSERVARLSNLTGRIATLGRPGGGNVIAAARWPAYLYFEYLVWRYFRRGLVNGKFDLVHRLTPLSPTYPSPLASWSPVPLILGPLNGALPWTGGTESIRAREREWLVSVRSVYRLLPYWRRTFDRAALVIAAGPHVVRDIPRRARGRTVIHPENGVDTDRFSPNSPPTVARRRPFTILFVGRLVPFKQPTLVIEAAARMQLDKTDVRVLFVGEGPERARIESTAERLGMATSVELVGHVPHERLPSYYRRASIFAFPSVHESGGAVLLEAMACGLPCVVLDYGGPSQYVSDYVGIRVPLGSYDAMLAGFSDAFTTLALDVERRQAYSRAAVDRANNVFSWAAKGDLMVGLYERVVGRPQRA